MIDMKAEEMVPLSKAGRHLPKNHKDVNIGRGTLRRWTTIGRRGVLLEYVVLGGLLYTSVEALQRFADAQTELDLSKCRPPESPKIQPSQKKAIEAANKRARELGWFS